MSVIFGELVRKHETISIYRVENNERQHLSLCNHSIMELFVVKQGHHKLINSSEQSKDAQESKKKKFLLDTYARITAARNKGCSKRLHELAKPKNYINHNGTYEDFENYFQTINKYNTKLPLLKKR